MLTVTMGVEELPPDASGHNRGARDTLTATAATYDEALTQLERQVPEGWRSTSIWVDRSPS